MIFILIIVAICVWFMWFTQVRNLKEQFFYARKITRIDRKMIRRRDRIIIELKDEINTLKEAGPSRA